MDPYAQIAERISPGATLVRRWPLRGGVSAHVEGLEMALPDGRRRRVVLRRHGAAAWKTLDSDVTVTEFNLLTALVEAALAVPEPLFVITSNDLLGSPFFVMEFVDGVTDVDPAQLPHALRHMAEYLSRLHALQLDVSALPAREDPVSGALAPKNALVLVHGDYWPGNVLWKDGEIAAVIDWEDAGVGDPLSDLAGCRLELLWKYGAEAAETFTSHYLDRARIDPTDLPFWELYAASAAAALLSEWGLDPAQEADMRRKAEGVVGAARSTILART
jgi:aminoglycoside phosphotransferase (APT) family kinase protein